MSFCISHSVEAFLGLSLMRILLPSFLEMPCFPVDGIEKEWYFHIRAYTYMYSTLEHSSIAAFLMNRICICLFNKIFQNLCSLLYESCLELSVSSALEHLFSTVFFHFCRIHLYVLQLFAGLDL